MHGEQGWCSGKSACLTTYGRGSIPASRHVNEFVVGSRLASRVFLQVLRFTFLLKKQHSKFQFDQDRGPSCKPTEVDLVASVNFIILFIIMKQY